MTGTGNERLSDLLESFGVLFSGVILVFLQSGTFKASGVFFKDVVVQYETSNLLAGWAFTFQAAGAFFVAGVVGVFLKGFSNRTVGVCGGVLFGLGLVLNGVAGQSVDRLFVFTGFTAVGGGLLYFSSYMAFLEHFDDDTFPLAYSIRELFTYLGIGIIPFLLDFLRHTYGLSGGFLILGGITWNTVVAGVLMKPPRTRKRQLSPKTHSAINGRRSVDKNRLEDEIAGDIAEQSQIPITQREIRTEILKKILLIETTSFHQKYSERMAFVSKMTSAVIHHKQFTVFCIIHSLFSYIFCVWAIFLVPLGISRGIPVGYPVLLSTVGGIGGFIGKITVFAVIYHGKMTTVVSTLIPGVICGLSLTGYLVAAGFTEMCLSSFLCGYSLAFADAALNSTLPRYLCTVHIRQGTTFSYVLSGTMMQIGGILSGAMVDVTGSFYVVFASLLALDLLILPLAVIIHNMEAVNPRYCEG